MKLNLLIFFLLLDCGAYANPFELIDAIKKKVEDPVESLSKEGSLVVLGNTSLDKANVVLLPEIHDDPASLLTQLLILARERKKGGQFLVLDESLAPLKQSSWELFSQKSMKILVAKDSRRSGTAYSPRSFELKLKNIAQELRNTPGQMTYLQEQGIWSFSTFVPEATLSYGWDSQTRGLSSRNVQMVKSLQAALEKSDRIFVMLGVRHVPELEFSSSQQLLCEKNRFKKIEDYFWAVNKKFGPHPELTHGIGATLPIYEFLKDKHYAVAFSSNLYGELDRVVKNLFTNANKEDCFYIF